MALDDRGVPLPSRALKLPRYMQVARSALGRQGDWTTSKQCVVRVEKGDRLIPAEDFKGKPGNLALSNGLV